MNDESLKIWKDFVVLNFVPSALIVGAASNLINFIILSRPCIKASSLNIYLNVLAFTDTLLLLSIFVITKQFYDDAHSQKHEIYWQTFGLTQWFHTAFVYINIYLTLFISFDRYCSMKRHEKPNEKLCRVSSAKNTASMILFICFLFSITAAFEFKLELEQSNCQRHIKTATTRAVNRSLITQLSEENEMAMANEDESWTFRDFNTTNLRHKEEDNEESNDIDERFLVNNRDNSTTAGDGSQANQNTCPYHLFPVESTLAQNKFYRAIFKPIASLLLLIPMILMLGVVWKLKYKNQRMRNQHQQHSSEIQQNKITRLVIALVVIFLICHTPNAVFTILKNSTKTFSIQDDSHDDDDEEDNDDSDETKIKNFILGTELLCFVLMCFNCCWKMFLYLMTYDEFLMSIRSFKSCFKNTQDDVENKKKSFPPPQFTLSFSESEQQIINLVDLPRHPPQRLRQTSISIPFRSTSQEPKTTQPKRRMSMMPSVAFGVNPTKIQTSNELTDKDQQQRRVARQQSTRSQKIFEISKLNPSQTNLTRSRSMTIQTQLKHSPNCKWRKNIDN